VLRSLTGLVVALSASACGTGAAVTGDAPAPSDAAAAAQKPAITALPMPANPVAGGAVSFRARLGDPDGLVAAAAWSFGDGGSASDDRPTRAGADVDTVVEHTFTASGVYHVSVSVSVSEAGGTTVSRSTWVAVAPAGSRCATHNFSVTSPDFYYAFDGVPGENPAVTVCLGEPFVFHLDDVSFMHPFCIWVRGAPVEAPGVTANCQTGTTDVVWAVPDALPEGAQYLCEIHYFGNVITVL
jgi:hypothetical protein